MSEVLEKDLSENKNYDLGKKAYDAYCSSDDINWKSYKGDPLPQFGENLPRIQRAWIESAQAVKKENESKQFCFIQDSDCHWFLLPVEYKDEFETLNEQEDWEVMEKFSQYRTGGGIGNIYFSNPSYYPF